MFSIYYLNISHPQTVIDCSNAGGAILTLGFGLLNISAYMSF